MLYLWYIKEQRGKGVKVVIWSEEEISYKRGVNFYVGGVDPSTSPSELPTFEIYFPPFYLRALHGTSVDSSFLACMYLHKVETFIL